jgi:hypothetical protein
MVLKTTLAALPDIEELRQLTQSLAMSSEDVCMGWSDCMIRGSG